MTPSLRAAPLAILASIPLAAFTLAACSAAPPPEAPPAPMEPPPNLFGVTGKGTSPVDEQMLTLIKAEDEIDKLFPHAEKKAPLGRPRKPGAAPNDKVLEQKAMDDKQAEPLSDQASSCSVACRALQSMQTSADHLCKLTGEGDGRCDDARGRVRGATARVRSVCPACAAAAR
jgi:hypothetical protein